MAIYLCFLGLLIITKLVTPCKKNLLICFATVYILLVIFRDSTVGTDTRGYILDFVKAGEMSWDRLFDVYNPNYGYFILSKIFYLMGVNVHIWFGIVGFIYIFSVCVLISKYSDDALISICLFFALGFFAFSLAGLKQIMAMSFLNFALYFVKEKKNIWAFVFAAIACFFHITALITAIIYLGFVLIKNEDRQMTICLVIILVMFFFRSGIMSNIFSYFEETESHYGAYRTEGKESQYSFTGLIIQLAMLVYSLIFNRKDKMGVILLSFACLFQYYSTGANGIASMFRISMYFNSYSLIYVGNTISQSLLANEKKIACSNTPRKATGQLLNTPSVYYTAFVGILILYFIISTIRSDSIYPYIFLGGEK